MSLKKACSLHLAYNNSTFRDGHKKVTTFFPSISHTHTQYYRLRWWTFSKSLTKVRGRMSCCCEQLHTEMTHREIYNNYLFLANMVEMVAKRNK